MQQQNLYAQSQSNIALGLIQIYRALGGGWDLRLDAPPAEHFVETQMPAVVPEPLKIEPLPIVPRVIPGPELKP